MDPCAWGGGWGRALLLDVFSEISTILVPTPADSLRPPRAFLVSACVARIPPLLCRTIAAASDRSGSSENTCRWIETREGGMGGRRKRTNVIRVTE